MILFDRVTVLPYFTLLFASRTASREYIEKKTAVLSERAFFVDLLSQYDSELGSNSRFSRYVTISLSLSFFALIQFTLPLQQSGLDKIE